MSEATESSTLPEDEIAQDPLAAALGEIDVLKDKYLRVVAEMQNIQKRAQRDIEDATKYAVVSSAKPFLAVADNLDRALQSAPQTNDPQWQSFLEGIRATQRALNEALTKMGVVKVAAEVGMMLNPHEHEVMFEAPSDTQANGTIVQVLEQGYKIHDRLLRPARVSVAKNQSGNAEHVDHLA
jgi:molecular chaperone GrpE